MPDLTTRRGYVKPLVADPVTELRESISLNADLSDNEVVFDSGPFSNRPVSTPGSPGLAGRIYQATDRNNQWYRDYGTGWATMGGEYEVATSLPANDAANDGRGLRLLVEGHYYPIVYVHSLTDWIVESPLAQKPLASRDLATDVVGIGTTTYARHSGPYVTIPASTKLDALVAAHARMKEVDGSGTARVFFTVSKNQSTTPSLPIKRQDSGEATEEGDVRGEMTGLVATNTVDHMTKSLNSAGVVTGRWIEVYPTRFRV